MNQSAVTSLEEAPGGNPDPPPAGDAPIPETKLPNHQLHRSPHSMTGELTRKVRRWNNSPQRHRWVAAALLDIEPRLIRRVSGYKHLPLLRQALNKDLNLDNEQNARQESLTKLRV